MRASIADKAIYLEEKQLRMYSVTVLFVSQNLTDLPFSLLHGLVYSSIIYWSVGFQSLLTNNHHSCYTELCVLRGICYD